MEPFQRYLALEKKFQSFLDGQENNSKEVLSPDDFTLRLIEAANDEGYHLHSYYGQNPHVVIIGFNHGPLDSEPLELVDILKRSLSQNDMILREGRDAAEIIYEHYHCGDLIEILKDFLAEKDIRTVYNEKGLVIGKYWSAASKLVKAIQQNRDAHNDPEFRDLAVKYIESFDARDNTFCYHPSVGIVPLIRGTAKNYRQLDPGARLFQLVGLRHVYNGVIQKNLETENIAHLVLVQTNEI